jgi:hypothetical protein
MIDDFLIFREVQGDKQTFAKIVSKYIFAKVCVVNAEIREKIWKSGATAG